MSDPDRDAADRSTPRRTVLKSAAVVGVAVPFLAACGAHSSNRTASAGSGGSTTTPETSGSGGGGGKTSSGGSAGAAAIAETTDVPEGGGVILDDPAIVITQPSAGEFKGFSPICTHQGCTVGSVSDGEIICPCHQSHFSIADGSVVSGPAPAPLPAIDINVNGTDISLA